MILGIDLGTTNSVAAVIQNKEIMVLDILPSIVSYDEISRPLVGYQAKSSGNVLLSSSKRLMGKGLSEIEDDSPLRNQINLQLSDDSIIHLNGGNGNSYTCVEIAAAILSKIKNNAEKKVGATLDKIVLTVPAHFNESARAATRDAARIAGLDVLRIINEPTAAAVAYGLQKKPNGIFLIYDLGGGTFDISILQMKLGVLQVIATGGSTFIGGDDFDHALQKYLGNSFLLAEAKEIKEYLSDNKTWNNGEVNIDRTDIEENVWKELVNKTIKITLQVLQDAQLKSDDISDIILVGGVTRMPIIKHRIQQVFNKVPLSDLNPDEIVGIGAAFQGQALIGASNHLLLDVTPLTLGIEVAGGVVEAIIHRNTPIPATVTQSFGLQNKEQKYIKIHILQGESKLVEKCRSIAKFILPCHGGDSDTSGVDVNFCIDADGLLMVSASDKSTGNKQEIIVCPSYGLNESEVRRLITNSTQHKH